MKVIKPAKTTRLTIVLTMVALSIAAISSGATMSAFAQQTAIDLEELDLPEIPEIDLSEIPENEEDVIPCLPPPECLLPGAEVCIQVCWPFTEE
jgi:hypothetical protein